MKTSMKLLFAGLLSGMLFSACSKEEAVNDLNSNPQHLTINDNSSSAGSADDGTVTTTGMLNRELQIVYATDGKSNLSTEFTGYSFKFTGTEPNGEAIVVTPQGEMMGTWAWKEGSTVWSMDFSNTTLAQGSYLSREWMMQPSSSATTMVLVAPDGDRLYFTAGE
jgi:hypothetical protein